MKQVYSRVQYTKRADLETLRKCFYPISTRFIRLFKTPKSQLLNISNNISNTGGELNERQQRLGRISRQQQTELGLRVPNVYKERDEEIKGGRKKFKAFKAGKKSKDYCSEKGFNLLTSNFDSSIIFDNELYAKITDNAGKVLPSLPEKPQRQDITDSDEKSLRAFTSRSDGFSGCILSCTIKAGIAAAEHLGIYSPNSQRKRVGKISNSVEALSKNTNSGAPYFGRKNDPSIKVKTKKWMRDMLFRPDSSKFLSNSFAIQDPDREDFFCNNPTKIFHRFQIKAKEKLDKTFEFVVKIRQVLCISYGVLGFEHMFFGEIMNDVKIQQDNLKDPCYSTGSTRTEISNNHVARIRSLHKYGLPEYMLASGDFESLDQSIDNIFFDIFFGIVEQNIIMSKYEKKVWNYLRCFMKFTPVIYMGELFFLSRGIASGCLITNLFDTWVHLTLVYLTEFIETDEEFGKIFDVMLGLKHQRDVRVDWKYLQGMRYTFIHYFSGCGDDSIMYINSSFKYKFLKVCRYLGFKVGFDNIQKDPKGKVYYLGTYWDSNNEPFQTDEYLISHICFRERYQTNSDLESKGFDGFGHYLLSRNLSICLRFKNGLKFLRTYLFNWEPFQKWYDDKEADLYVVPKWPFEEGYTLERHLALHWGYY